MPLNALADRRTMTDQVAESLRSAIQSGALPDGSELNQIALAERYGVSRVPVREAMRQLQAEGWIDAKAHQRAVVRAIGREEVLEILELRLLLETFLIEKTIAAMTPRVLDALERICVEMESVRDHERWLECNRAFHRELYVPSASVTAIVLVEGLSSQVERYLRAHGETIARESEAVAEHRAILGAVAAGDVVAARRLITLHIGHTRERFLATTPAL